MDNKTRMDLIIGLPYNCHITAFVMAESHKENVRKAGYDALHAAERTRIFERAKTQTTEAIDATYEFTHILVNQLRSSLAIAKTAGIDLEITTDSRILNPESLDEFIKTHRTCLEEFQASIKAVEDGRASRA